MNRTCLITGGAGFIGSHLAEACHARGDLVIVLDDLSTGSERNLAALAGADRFRLVVASVLDEELVAELVSQSDLVFHLAAAVGVKLVVEHPARTLLINLRGVENVLQAAANSGNRVFFASTSEVYGQQPDEVLTENGQLVIGPTTRRRWAYACSKATDEFLALAFHDEFGLDVTIGRFFNTVGPRQTGRYGMVLPRFVTQALSGEPINVYGDGTQKRCFCHVADTVRATLLLADSPQSIGRVFNIGNPEEVTIAELAALVRDKVGSDSPTQYIPFDEIYGGEFDEIHARFPDIERIHSLVGFSPRYSLDRIVDDVIAYHREMTQC